MAKKDITKVLGEKIEKSEKLYKKFIKNPEKVVRKLAKKKRFTIDDDNIGNIIEGIKKKVDMDDVKYLINELKDKLDLDDAREIYEEIKDKLEITPDELDEAIDKIQDAGKKVKLSVLKLFKKK